jgi:hypothetical protein
MPHNYSIVDRIDESFGGRPMRLMLWAATAGLAASLAARAQQMPPEIQYDSVPDFFKLPENTYFGEVAGIAVNSKKHIFVLSRGNTTGPAYGAAATQLLEFDQNGRFVREIGKNLYSWAFAHTVRVDRHDDIWVSDKGSDMVIRFDPAGRVKMVFGRKPEASDEGAHPLEHPQPPLAPIDGQFRQVTDVAWDSAENIYISDGYINSRVAKYDKDGNWVASYGSYGAERGQFNTLHSIAIDARDRVYVADRGNRRIQVLDTSGKVLDVYTIDVPVPPNAPVAIGNRPAETARRAVGHLHHAAAEPSHVRVRLVPGAHLQDVARRQGSRLARRLRQDAQEVRLDPRARVSVRERALRRGAAELARTEAAVALTADCFARDCSNPSAEGFEKSHHNIVINI